MAVIWMKLLLISICIWSCSGRLSRGDLCEQDDGRPGRCELMYDCQTGMKDLKDGLKPKICGFDDITPIICCSQPIVQRNIAMEKCFEYMLDKFSMDLRFKKIISEIEKNNTIDSNTTVESNVTVEHNKTVERNKIVETRRRRQIDLEEENFIKDLFNETIFTQTLAAINGQPSMEREFPHMAALGYENKTGIAWLCGGSLISEEYVLTAAHCLSSRDHGEVKYVRLGDLNLYSVTDAAQPQDFLISKKIQHPAYKPPEKYHDIALLKLDRPVVFNDYIRPACLHTEHQINETNLIATGWGLTEVYGNPSDHLIKVNLELFTDEECKRIYRPMSTLKRGINSEGMICAGGRTEEKGTCTGDSGGPLQSDFRNVGDLYTIFGVTSFGKSCAIINAGGVYTRVSRYVPWIESIVWPQVEIV